LARFNLFCDKSA